MGMKIAVTLCLIATGFSSLKSLSSNETSFYFGIDYLGVNLMIWIVMSFVLFVVNFCVLVFLNSGGHPVITLSIVGMGAKSLVKTVEIPEYN